LPLNRESVTVNVVGVDKFDTSAVDHAINRGATLARMHMDRYEGVIRTGYRSRVLHKLYQFLHPLGVHEWVKVLIYDYVNDRLIDPGHARVTCRNCRGT
jgi:hypothetical protein